MALPACLPARPQLGVDPLSQQVQLRPCLVDGASLQQVIPTYVPLLTLLRGMAHSHDVCVCVCVRVHACVCVCTRACVFVCVGGWRGVGA